MQTAQKAAGRLPSVNRSTENTNDTIFLIQKRDEPDNFFSYNYAFVLGMEMANQLELISFDACCGNRATKGSPEAGDNVPYGRQISGQKTGPYPPDIRKSYQ